MIRSVRIGKGDTNKFQNLAQSLLLNANAQQARMASTKCESPILSYPFNLLHFVSSSLIKSLVQAIAQRFLENCIEAGQSLRAVKPLHSAVLKVSPSSSTLTPLHSSYLHACLLSKCYHMGLVLIEQEIFDVATDSCAVTIKDVLSYFYFAGLIYIGLKKYKKALAALRIVSYFLINN